MCIRDRRKLKEQGVLVCAATGRPLNQMHLILERIPYFDYMVLINGGYAVSYTHLYTDDSHLFKKW